MANLNSSSSPHGSGSAVVSPCGACKFLRRKCTKACIFAPHFPPDQGQRFANVHKVFGASNVAKLLQDLPVQNREDAVNSISYEADARVNDPIYGCVGALFSLQQQVAFETITFFPRFYFSGFTQRFSVRIPLHSLL